MANQIQTPSASLVPIQTSSPSSSLNFHHFLTIKLDRTNYLLWKSQFIPLLRGHDLLGYVDGSKACPAKSDLDAYSAWQKQDQLLLSWILTTLSESILVQVLGLATSNEVWTALKRQFSSHNRARLMQLRLQLQTLKKNNLPMDDYL